MPPLLSREKQRLVSPFLHDRFSLNNRHSFKKISNVSFSGSSPSLTCSGNEPTATNKPGSSKSNLNFANLSYSLMTIFSPLIAMLGISEEVQRIIQALQTLSVSTKTKDLLLPMIITDTFLKHDINLLQWNCHGLINKREFLVHIINDFDPCFFRNVAFCGTIFSSPKLSHHLLRRSL